MALSKKPKTPGPIAAAESLLTLGEESFKALSGVIGESLKMVESLSKKFTPEHQIKLAQTLKKAEEIKNLLLKDAKDLPLIYRKKLLERLVDLRKDTMAKLKKAIPSPKNKKLLATLEESFFPEKEYKKYEAEVKKLDIKILSLEDESARLDYKIQKIHQEIVSSYKGNDPKLEQLHKKARTLIEKREAIERKLGN